MTPLYLYIAYEDELTYAVIQKTLAAMIDRKIFIQRLRRGGFGYLKKNVANFNRLANNVPVLMVTDLDRAECAPQLIRKWHPNQLHADFLFRVAVREVEAWIMADREEFAAWLRISIKKIPPQIETVLDPKALLISLVRASRKRALIKDIVPAPNSTAHIGKNYNEPLIRFVNERWDVHRAAAQSNSLARLLQRVDELVARKAVHRK